MISLQLETHVSQSAFLVEFTPSSSLHIYRTCNINNITAIIIQWSAAQLSMGNYKYTSTQNDLRIR